MECLSSRAVSRTAARFSTAGTCAASRNFAVAAKPTHPFSMKGNLHLYLDGQHHTSDSLRTQPLFTRDWRRWSFARSRRASHNHIGSRSAHDQYRPPVKKPKTSHRRTRDALVASWETAISERRPEVWNHHYCFGTTGRQTMVSEIASFASMGLHPADLQLSESAMHKQLHPLPLGIKTPEGIFSVADRSWLRRALPRCERVSVEVKRVAFHRIPDRMSTKYKNQYSRQAGWYLELIQEAVDQITLEMTVEFRIDGHVVCVAVPESMPYSEVEDIQCDLREQVTCESCPVHCLLTVQRVPDDAFGQLLKLMRE